MTYPSITIIAALSRNGVIAIDGQLPPWKLPKDVVMFKELTTGWPVIMGRKTWESLPEHFRPLPNRTNVVVSGQLDYQARGACTASSLDAAIEMLENEKHLFIGGGGQIYQQAMPLADRLILTRVDVDLAEDRAIFFPAIPQMFWRKEVALTEKADAKHSHDFNVEVWHKGTWPMPPNFCLANTRNLAQLIQMLKIDTEGVCPFCYEHFGKFHREPILAENSHWLVTKNDWPYAGSKLHLLFVPKKHIEDLSELSAEEYVNLGDLIRWANIEYTMHGATLFFRSGDPRYTCGTVNHLHGHLIVGGTNRTGAETLKVKVGYKAD